jgi:threonine/homoserine efflux transporter RhtA
MYANVPSSAATECNHACIRRNTRSQKEIAMNAQISLAPIIALLAGILILFQPRLLNYIVAIYLIVIGLLGLFGGSLHL